MSHVRAIHVDLTTAIVPDAAATTDRLYLGLAGTDGGREFPLSVQDQQLFEPGVHARILFGLEEELVPNGLGTTPIVDFQADRSRNPNQRNSPRFYRVEQADVTHVYLRKEGDRTTAGDDAWKLSDVVVQLHDPFIGTPLANRIRTFINQDPVAVDPESQEDAIWLGNEFGHQVWLREV